MSAFHRSKGELRCEGVALQKIADTVGTPAYVYSRAQLLANYAAIADGPHRPNLVCYSVKALSNLAVLKLLAEAGSGFDVVSGGELARVLAAGGEASKVVFSGVAKTDSELAEALWAGIGCFNVESEQELAQLSAVAQHLQKTAPFSLRVNPDIDARTHPYVATALRESKFGVPLGRARALYAAASKLPGLQPVGVDFHLGSQIASLAPFRQAVREVGALVAALLRDGHPIRHLDVGGGLGIPEGKRRPPTPAQWLAVLRRELRALPVALLVEPGRAIAGNAGALLTRVLGHKNQSGRRFLLVDAAMNDLIRPALYDARHEIVPVQATRVPAALVDVVGPVCESADFLAKRRRLPLVAPGGLLAVLDAGAYGFSMSSNYNSRLRPPEVLVEGSTFRIIREREQREDLWRGETV
jgi:diaminopimelate decarboxylase